MYDIHSSGGSLFVTARRQDVRLTQRAMGLTGTCFWMMVRGVGSAGEYLMTDRSLVMYNNERTVISVFYESIERGVSRG